MAKTISLNDLLKQYNSTPVYKKKTAAQIKKQAKGEYKSYYDQLRLSAKQQQQQSDLALQQQRDALQATYDKQREASEKNYRMRYSQADRQMLSRGMQRSSYGAQVLANIDLEGAEAIQDLYDQQGAAEGNIDAQRAQLAQQLAAQLSQYNAGEAADVLKRIRELEDQDYQRGLESAQTRNQLSTQIYQLMYQAGRDKVADDQWNAQFKEGKRQFNVTHNNKRSSGGGGGGGSGGGSSNKANALQAQEATANGGKSDYDAWLARMNGDGSKKNATKPKKDNNNPVNYPRGGFVALPFTPLTNPNKSAGQSVAPANKNPDKNLGYRKVNDKINRAI